MYLACFMTAQCTSASPTLELKISGGEPDFQEGHGPFFGWLWFSLGRQGPFWGVEIDVANVPLQWSRFVSIPEVGSIG